MSLYIFPMLIKHARSQQIFLHPDILVDGPDASRTRLKQASNEVSAKVPSSIRPEGLQTEGENPISQSGPKGSSRQF